VEIWYENTTPIVGDSPDSVVPPDTDHIEEVLQLKQPYAVLALGKQAEIALTPFCSQLLPLLAVPHPAHRLLTNELYQHAGRLLVSGIQGSSFLAVRQREGRIFLDYCKCLAAEGGAR
jgi:hypothetical protein